MPRTRLENRYCGPCLRTTAHRIEGTEPNTTWNCTRCNSRKHRVTPTTPHSNAKPCLTGPQMSL